jgi:hypothetical protein
MVHSPSPHVARGLGDEVNQAKTPLRFLSLMAMGAGGEVNFKMLTLFHRHPLS